MKRQKVRKGLIMVSFLFFPLSLYYFSPNLIMQGALEGVAAGSFIVFALMALSAVFFGRAWCGWLCPAGGLQETCHMVNNKPAAGGKGNLVKYVFWAFWIGLIVFFFIKAGGVHKVNFLYQIDHGISVSEPRDYIIFYFVVLTIVIMSFTLGRRAFCHYLCWMAPFMVIGSKISHLLRIPAMGLVVNNKNCLQCKKCDEVCPMSLKVHEMVRENYIKNSECILCGSCADKCPRQLIRLKLRKH